MKLKLNDLVTVIAGKDKGKSGKITKMFPKENKAIVAGVNKYKRHLKRKDDQNPGGVVEVERPINLSKVMLTVDGKLTRVGYTLTKTNEKIRIAKKTKAPINKS